jgi:hypothetical protein
MMITNPHILIYAYDDNPSMEKKEFEFLQKIQFLRYDVTKWSPNVKMFLIWKALIKGFHMRYNMIWYRMVPSISKFDLG